LSRINLIARDNGVGLSRDLQLLAAALRAGGHDVSVLAIGGGKFNKKLRPLLVRAGSAVRGLGGRAAQKFDVNLMLEHVRPEYFPLARHNVLMPNPEWFVSSDIARLPGFDRVFVKTRHAEKIFGDLGCRTTFTGFTSPDRNDGSVRRERAFFHLAGRSQNKNTEPLLALWRRHPWWPRLTVVQNPRTAKPGPPAANIEHRVDYLDDTQLRELQNAHRFHLCPSETEGFGHYLVEAMSLGAVTLTLDAAPMNELITPERGVLVPVARTGRQNLAATNFFDEAAMTAAIERMIALDDNAAAMIGAAARSWFEGNDRAFRQRVDAAVRDLG
jgi:Glycosyl transferases group 1